MRDQSSSPGPPDQQVVGSYGAVESMWLAFAAATVLLCLFLGCMSSRRRGSRGHLNVPTYATVQKAEGEYSAAPRQPIESDVETFLDGGRRSKK